MKNDWQLINAEQRNRQNPRTFQLPPLAERTDLKPGQEVKIGVEQRQDVGRITGERFWVVVVGAGKRLQYLGMIANVLVKEDRHGLQHRQEIEFGPEHIFQTETPGEPGHN